MSCESSAENNSTCIATRIKHEESVNENESEEVEDFCTAKGNKLKLNDYTGDKRTIKVRLKFATACAEYVKDPDRHRLLEEKLLTLNKERSMCQKITLLLIQ